MKVVKADPFRDADRITEFFNSTSLESMVDFKIIRKNFFDQYRIQSDDWETLMMIDGKEQIQGIVSLIFHSGAINGERQRWALATDLRIANTRQAIVNWSNLFLPHLMSALEERGCKYTFANVLQYDNLAYNALIRPQSERRKLPRYYLLNRFRVMCIHGRWPFSRDPLPSIHISNATMNDIEPISAYLSRKALNRVLALNHEPEQILARIARHPGMKVEDFLLARNRKNEIVGVTLPWRSDQVSSWRPTKYHGFALGVHSLLWWASWPGLVQPFPTIGNSFKSKILTHLSADNPDILMAIFDHAYNMTSRGEILMYTYFTSDWKMLPPRSFVTTSIPWGLYVILPSTEVAPSWLIPDHYGHSPEFPLQWL